MKFGVEFGGEFGVEFGVCVFLWILGVNGLFH